MNHQGEGKLIDATCDTISKFVYTRASLLAVLINLLGQCDIQSVTVYWSASRKRRKIYIVRDTCC